MEKKKTIIKKEIQTTYFCDICKTKIGMDMCFNQMNQCHYCGRLMCNVHRTTDLLYEGAGDNEPHICTECRKICMELVDQIRALRANAEEEEARLYGRLRKLCKANFKKRRRKNGTKNKRK
jgi:hypothetical protein